MKISAPAIDSGTETRITNGSRKLSNSAASARKTMMIAKRKVIMMPLDSWMNCRDLAGVVDRVALRQRARRESLQVLQRILQRHAGR